MFDLDNLQLITSPLEPGDITDTKQIIFAEIDIPGLNYKPIQYGGGGNRELSFTLSLIQRNNTIGNVLLLKQFDQLRNQATGLSKIGIKKEYRSTPKVLFNWGIGSVPLEYYVTKCDFTHKQYFRNNLSNPENTEVSMTLKLDERSPLYEAEEAFREFSALTGLVVNNYNIIESQITGVSNI